MAEVLSVAFFIGKFNFFVSLLVVKDKNYSRNMCILFCRPTQAQGFHDVLCWHLIFLLHPTALHENITLQLRSLSLENDIAPTHLDSLARFDSESKWAWPNLTPFVPI